MISKEIKETLIVPTGERDKEDKLITDEKGQPIVVERIAVTLEKRLVRFEVLEVTGSVRGSRLWMWRDADGLEIQSKIENVEMNLAEFVDLPGFKETKEFIKARFDEKDPV